MPAARTLPLPALLHAAGRHVCDCGGGSAPGCIAGAAGNAGEEPASPLRSQERARLTFAGLAAGEAIRLCRGGTWRHPTRLAVEGRP